MKGGRMKEAMKNAGENNSSSYRIPTKNVHAVVEEFAMIKFPAKHPYNARSGSRRSWSA